MNIVKNLEASFSNSILVSIHSLFLVSSQILIISFHEDKSLKIRIWWNDGRLGRKI